MKLHRCFRRIKPKVQDPTKTFTEAFNNIPKAIGMSEKTYAMVINSFFVNGNDAKTVATEANVTESAVKAAVSLHLKYNLLTNDVSQPVSFTSCKSKTSTSKAIVLSAEQEELLVQYKRQNSRATLKDLQSFVREDRDSFPQITNIGLSTLYNILKRHGMNTSRRRVIAV
ncbi:uncharacterized protein LOC143228927 isoform X2 [Tachypleus tridentatus]|uniref:uncharacterized protein LOC143228927 isoform X2 n=1 Tax=Tachypleus tridentatus TaxID=6853 RepID=UPI003FD5ED49